MISRLTLASAKFARTTNQLFPYVGVVIDATHFIKSFKREETNQDC